MSLTITPAVTSFKANALDKITPDQLNKPGMYTVVESYGPSPFEEKKQGSFLGSLVKTVLGIGVLAGAIVGGRKLFMKEFKVEANAPEGLMKKAKHYFAKTADLIEDYTWKPLQKLWKKEENTKTDTPKTEVPAGDKSGKTPEPQKA